MEIYIYILRMIISDHDIEDGIPITVWYSIMILCWELKYYSIMGIPSLTEATSISWTKESLLFVDRSRQLLLIGPGIWLLGPKIPWPVASDW